MLYFGPHHPQLLNLSCKLKTKLVVDTEVCQSSCPNFYACSLCKPLQYLSLIATIHAPASMWQLFHWSHPRKSSFSLYSFFGAFFSQTELEYKILWILHKRVGQYLEASWRNNKYSSFHLPPFWRSEDVHTLINNAQVLLQLIPLCMLFSSSCFFLHYTLQRNILPKMLV